MFRLSIYTCGVFLLTTSVVAAIEFSAPTPARIYEPIALGNDPVTIREYYGNLTGDPYLYEVIALKDFSLRTVLEQPRLAEIPPEPLRLLVVREVTGGRVETVVRSEIASAWQPVLERWSGFVWWQTILAVDTLPPGTYRIEVSSATNQGAYRLTLGTDAPSFSYIGYWQRLWFVADYFNLSTWSLLTSWFVLTHGVFALILIFVWYYLFPQRRRVASSPVRHD